MAEEVAKPVPVVAAEEPALASGPPPPSKDVVEEKAVVPAAPVAESKASFNLLFVEMYIIMHSLVFG